MTAQIEKMETQFEAMDAAKKEEFIRKLQEKAQEVDSEELRDFLDRCVTQYNRETDVDGADDDVDLMSLMDGMSFAVDDAPYLKDEVPPMNNLGRRCTSCGSGIGMDMAFCSKCGIAAEAKKLCPKCGTRCASDMTFCIKCGFHLDATPCPDCSTIVKPGMTFCGKCGCSTAGGVATYSASGNKIDNASKKVGGLIENVRHEIGNNEIVSGLTTGLKSTRTKKILLRVAILAALVAVGLIVYHFFMSPSIVGHWELVDQRLEILNLTGVGRHTSAELREINDSLRGELENFTEEWILHDDGSYTFIRTLQGGTNRDSGTWHISGDTLIFISHEWGVMRSTHRFSVGRGRLHMYEERWTGGGDGFWLETYVDEFRRR